MFGMLGSGLNKARFINSMLETPYTTFISCLKKKVFLTLLIFFYHRPEHWCFLCCVHSVEPDDHRALSSKFYNFFKAT